MGYSHNISTKKSALFTIIVEYSIYVGTTTAAVILYTLDAMVKLPLFTVKLVLAIPSLFINNHISCKAKWIQSVEDFAFGTRGFLANNSNNYLNLVLNIPYALLFYTLQFSLKLLNFIL